MFQIRKLAVRFVGLLIDGGEVYLEFSRTIRFDESLVIDFYLAVLIINGKIMVKMKAFEVGSFKHYSLKYSEKKQVFLDIGKGLKVVIPNSLDMSGARCLSSVCKVEKVNATSIEIMFFEISDGEIAEYVFRCSFAREPIQIAGILIFTALISGILFYDNDKIDFLIEGDQIKFTTFYHLTSLFIKQKKFRRLSSSFQILSTVLTTMSIVGLSISSMDSNLSNLKLDFESFTLESFGSGIIALCCCQVLTVINTVLKYFSYTRERFEKHLIALNFIIAILAFISICFICALHCISSALFWMINFTIFACIQVILIEPVYALVFYLLCRKRQIMKGKKVTMPSEITSSKVFQTSYASGFSTQETPTSRSMTKLSPRYQFS